jgi:hypothetical protein
MINRRYLSDACVYKVLYGDWSVILGLFHDLRQSFDEMLCTYLHKHSTTSTHHHHHHHSSLHNKVVGSGESLDSVQPQPQISSKEHDNSSDQSEVRGHVTVAVSATNDHGAHHNTLSPENKFINNNNDIMEGKGNIKKETQTTKQETTKTTPPPLPVDIHSSGEFDLFPNEQEYKKSNASSSSSTPHASDDFTTASSSSSKAILLDLGASFPSEVYWEKSMMRTSSNPYSNQEILRSTFDLFP